MRMLGLAVAIAFIASPVAAQAQTVPVDPGPIAKGRPILGTTQNLPSLDSEHPYDVGPGTASQLRRMSVRAAPSAPRSSTSGLPG